MAITPYLFYQDLAAALRFLSKAFGFKKFGATSRGKDGKLSHAAMKFGADLIMMGYPGPKYKNPKGLGQATQCMYINTTDADKLFARAKKAGAKILEEPKDTPYGARRFGVEDSEGHQWYFAQDLKKRARKKRR